MTDSDDTKPCPTCGGLGAVLAVERFGVKTFYCTDCEYDWDERAEENNPTPDAPSPQQ